MSLSKTVQLSSLLCSLSLNQNAIQPLNLFYHPYTMVFLFHGELFLLMQIPVADIIFNIFLERLLLCSCFLDPLPTTVKFGENSQRTCFSQYPTFSCLNLLFFFCWEYPGYILMQSPIEVSVTFPFLGRFCYFDSFLVTIL